MPTRGSSGSFCCCVAAQLYRTPRPFHTICTGISSSHLSAEKIQRDSCEKTQTGITYPRAPERVLCESPAAVEAQKRRAGIRQRAFRPQGVEGSAK
jgi:hypothetical protein